MNNCKGKSLFSSGLQLSLLILCANLARKQNWAIFKKAGGMKFAFIRTLLSESTGMFDLIFTVGLKYRRTHHKVVLGGALTQGTVLGVKNGVDAAKS